MPRSVGHIFDVLEEEQLEYLIQVSYLEIYNEQMFDLLSPNVDDTELMYECKLTFVFAISLCEFHVLVSLKIFFKQTRL